MKQIKDKRTSRKEHAQEFQLGVSEYRDQHDLGTPSRLESPFAAVNEVNVADLKPIVVAARARPIFESEVSEGEYSVVSVNHNKNSMIVHDGRMNADLKTMFMVHYELPMDIVFDDTATNEEVFASTAMPLVKYAVQGGLATLFVFGQTGSGKTFTMKGIMDLTSRLLYSCIASSGDSELTISTSAFELVGPSSILDLLNDRAAGTLCEDKNGTVFVRGVVENPVENAEQLSQMWQSASQLRATESTGANSDSSRSHSVIRVFIRKAGKAFGLLNLVDLAGSERKEDSMFHSSERRKEGAHINSSIMALKECIRLRLEKERTGADVHIPYRMNQLTQVLKSSFFKPNARTVVIVTVSPTPSDTEHTMNTLKHACLMKGNEQQITEAKVDITAAFRNSRPQIVPVAKWTAEMVREFLETSSGGKFAVVTSTLPSSTTGALLLRMALPRFVQLCRGDEALASQLMSALKNYGKDEKKGSVITAAAAAAASAGSFKSAGLHGKLAVVGSSGSDDGAAAAAAAAAVAVEKENNCSN